MAFDKTDLTAWDHRHVWHPFTQMREWFGEEPLFIESAEGAILRDVDGREFIDGFSSMWVNIHGHNRREINDAITAQLDKVAHSTMLGLSNVPATVLARRLVEIAPEGLTRVFYSDDGSTAIEVALKMAFQYWRHVEPDRPPRSLFIALDEGYHGDTIGVMSLGGVDLFRRAFEPLLFRRVTIPTPYCYRCRWDATPDACAWQCLVGAERILAEHASEAAALVVEPLIQCAGGFIVQPRGYLSRLAAMCRQHGLLLIADEVATGFGRTGTMFACEQEGVRPDIMAISKGLTGGYLPFAATLTTQKIFEAFLGEYGEFKHFFHGHSYTGNQLAAAAALASLDIFEREKTLDRLQPKIEALRRGLERFGDLPHVGDVRQCGFIGAVEVVEDRGSKRPFRVEDRIPHKVCLRARHDGVLLRPLGNVLYFMPPFCITNTQLERLLTAAFDALRSVTAKVSAGPHVP